VSARPFIDAGIDVHIGATVTAVRRPASTGPVSQTLEDGGEVQADKVLFATGRQPPAVRPSAKSGCACSGLPRLTARTVKPVGPYPGPTPR